MVKLSRDIISLATASGQEVLVMIGDPKITSEFRDKTSTVMASTFPLLRLARSQLLIKSDIRYLML